MGLIGLGDAWAERHAPALRALADRFVVRAVYEQVAHRAEQAAAEFGAVAVDGFRALIDRSDVDALLILSTQWFGALPILAACERGKPIYLAAVLHLDPDDVVAVARRAEQTGTLLMAEFPRRNAPATLRLKELVATRLGEPRLVFCHHRLALAGPSDQAAWRCGRSRPWRKLVELVDWSAYVVDRKPNWVTGHWHFRSSRGRSCDDFAMMSLDFSAHEMPGAGPLAQLSCGRYLPSHWSEAINYRPPAAMQIACEHGIAFVDLPASIVWFDEAGRHQESLDGDRPVGERLLARFHLAISGQIRPGNDLADAHRALRIVEQARRSHDEGRRIALNEFDGNPRRDD